MRWPSHVNWLLVLLAAWGVPVAYPHSYLFSLFFWALPVVLLLPDVLNETRSGTSRRRRALLYATGWIVALGLLLDFGIGHRVLTFQAQWYWFYVGSIPIEEVLFYILAPAAILLVYAWSDEHWLKAYNRGDARQHALRELPPLIEMSPRLVEVAVGLLGVILVIARWSHGEWRMPLYPTFLTVAAFVPIVSTYRAVNRFVNWRAFGLTTSFAIGTSLAHEVTLALPRGWWGYQSDQTLGLFIDAWSTKYSVFPVEAAFVWIAGPFSSVLTYEWFKAYLHHPASRRKARLFGP